MKLENKKTLEILAKEFGEDFLDTNKNGDAIGLYGANKDILSIFARNLENYLLSAGKRVPIVMKDASYNIDVGFFLHVGYFKGINKDVSTFLR